MDRIAEQKKEFRRKAILKRREIPAERRAEAEALITDKIAELLNVKNIKQLYLYASTPEEVDTDSIFAAAKEIGVEVFYPKVVEKEIRFSRIEDLSELKPGYRGIREPEGKIFETIADNDRVVCDWSESDTDSVNEDTSVSDQNYTGENASQFDEKAMIIVPGCAFSRYGKRMGYGGGYYDRYLSTHPSIYKVGICYAEQITEELPAEEHDILMDEVVFF